MKKPELIILGLDGACPGYIKTAVKQGKLPGFARLMKNGVFFDDCMPAFPSITPTCWSAISCGATPAVTGALCHQVHITGTHPTDYITPYSSINIRAERFWEAAAKIGKRSVMLGVPCSGPAKHENVLQILGGVTTTPDRCPADSALTGIPQQLFKNYLDGYDTVDSVKIRAGTWEDVKSKSSFDVLSDGIYRFYPVYNTARHDKNEVEPHEWIIICENDGVRIGTSIDDAKKSSVIHEGDWTNVITRRLMTDEKTRVPFHFRARLDNYDRKTQKFTVFVTASKNLYKEITPLSLAEEIAEIPETFTTDYTSIQPKHCTLEKFFEGESFSMKWKREVITHCINKYSPEIIFDYYESIDALNHRFRSAFEGVMISYDGEHEIALEAMEQCYKLADRHISWLLDNIAGKDTTIAIISDHGSIGLDEGFHQWKALEAAGLLVTTQKDDNLNWKSPYIDWSKTRAYPVGSCYINVNLKGREPCGIVEKKDFDKTVAEIITVLQQRARSSDNNTIALAFAVEGTQAGFIGHGGENCGDVVYGLAGSRVGGYIGGVHAHQIPSARSKTGDIRALCLISGPSFKENEILKRSTDLTDIAPTFCFALGYPQPKDATGGVIFSALK